MQIRFIRTLLFSLVLLSMAAASFAQIGVAIRIGPPALPVYEQPICPGDGYLWAPGYWAYDYDVTDYYWVPGTWVVAPEVGFLWTPAYWGWGGDGFVFYDGYWGPHVGFYGGINYGFGYFGNGFEGGRWDNGHFFYNRSVLNIDVTNIHNVYDTHVTYNNVSRVSYNGGNGGITARATADEEAAARERHIGPVATQTQHAQAARANPQQRASVNMGKPGVAATPRPGDFNDRAAVPAKEAGAPYTPAAVHPHDLAPLARTAPNTGNAKQDKKYQQQQDKQIAKQQQERDKLQQQQDQEHVKMDKQKASDSQRQQMEQSHQQQTQQLQQRHQQQQQQLQQKQQPANRESGKR
ncbi:MAG: YXWGXW repeat-containing protein [Terriglobales bacterium]